VPTVVEGLPFGTGVCVAREEAGPFLVERAPNTDPELDSSKTIILKMSKNFRFSLTAPQLTFFFKNFLKIKVIDCMSPVQLPYLVG